MTKRTPRSGRSGRPNTTVRAQRSMGARIALVLAVLAVAAIASWLLMRDDVPDFSGARALEEIERQVAFGPRTPGSEGHGAARAYLVEALRGYSNRVIEQTVTVPHPRDTAQTFQGTNIIASFQPEATRRVLLAAHWDTRAHADQDPDPGRRDEPVPGANDGASGVAVLLEMARIIDSEPPDVGVDVVLFDLEDVGEESTDDSSETRVPFAMGSEYFAASNADYMPAYGILLDMVCDADLRIPREANSAAYAAPVVDRIWAAARRAGADAFVDVRGPAVMDDHVAFLQRGIPVVDLIHLPFPDTWHTTADTPDHCAAASLQQVGDVLVRVLYE